MSRKNNGQKERSSPSETDNQEFNENFSNSKLTNWAKYINSYQVNEYPYVKGSFVDQSLVDYYNNEKKLLTSIKDVGKKGINRFTSKNYETNNLKLTKAINAETKQAISTLYQIGFTNEIILDNNISIVSWNRLYDKHSIKRDKDIKSSLIASDSDIKVKKTEFDEEKVQAVKKKVKFSIDIESFDNDKFDPDNCEQDEIVKM